MTRFISSRAPVVALSLLALLMSAPVNAQEPIKIGVQFQLGGVLGVMGGGAVNAIKLAFEEEGNTVAGRKIQLFVEDDEAKVDVSLSKLRKLVELERVDLLLASIFSNIGIGNRDYIFEKKIPWITLAAAATLTREKKGPYIFRMAPSNYQWGGAAAQYLKDKKGWKRVVLIGSNYAAPREGLGAAAKILGDAVVETVWPPLGAIDFAPFLTKLNDIKADGAFVAVWGSDALKFIPQYNDYGLDKKIPIFGAASFTSEEYLQGMPPQVEGVSSAFVYCGTLDNPLNKKFVEGYRAKVGANPGSYQYLGYMSAKVAIAAIKKVNGKVEDREAFARAIAETRIEGPSGLVYFDENHGLVNDMLVMTTRSRNGVRENECVDRIPRVADDYSFK